MYPANSPFKKQKDANESFVEWGKYMTEMLEAKKRDIQDGSEQEGMDLMGMLRGSFTLSPAKTSYRRPPSKQWCNSRVTLEE
jgi:hypothetical protein